MEYARESFDSVDFRLTVAIFNNRAIKVYEKAGFIKEVSFERKGQLQNTEFITMVLKQVTRQE